MPTTKELKDFLREWYLHSRFEGRDGSSWGVNYSDSVVSSSLDQLRNTGVGMISMYESRTGKPIEFDAGLKILNEDAPPPQIQARPSSIGRVIHGQAW